MSKKIGLEIDLEEENINLKHFIYLDRNKLYSYSSQLFGGIVQIKRLTENEGSKSIQSSDEEYKEEVKEDGEEGEISVGPKNHMGGLSGKRTGKTTNKQGWKKGINTKSDEFLYSSTEDIIEHDYGYLKFEEHLTNLGILKEIKDLEHLEKYSSLVKINGICRFIDWDSITEALANTTVMQQWIKNNLNLMGNVKLNSQQKQAMIETEENLKSGIELIKAFSLGSITVNVRVGNSNLIGTLNPEHIRVAREQLRSAYIMPGDIEMTIVGFIPKREIENINSISFPGIAGGLDMKEVWKVWVGEIDAVIEPIAIYTEIK